MIARNCTKEELEKALEVVNVKYEGNITFKRLEEKGHGFIFTLTVEDSRQLGARRSPSGRRISAACWHVHGDFFAARFETAPKARVFSSFYRRKNYSTTGRTSGWITKDEGNWEDGNIGSMMNPMNYSDACDC